MISKQFTILFVEDNIDIREEMELYLSSVSKKYYIAEDGLEGLKLFKEKKPDMILSDITMPKMNGLDMAKEIRSLSSDVPIILLTGQNDIELLKEAIDLSIDKYINKPINLKLLSTSINKIAEVLNVKLEMKQQATLLEQYKNIVDMNSIVSKTDVDDNITYVNEQFCTVSGYSRAELIGKKRSIIRDPSMQVEVYEAMFKTTREDKVPWKGEVKNKKKDGSYYWVLLTVNPILDYEKKIIEFITLSTDITHEVDMREYFQNQLNITTKKFSSALNVAKEYEKAINESTLVSRTNREGVITYVNQQFIDISGFPKDEIIGRRHSIVKHPDNSKEFFTNVWETILSGQTWSGIFKNLSRKKDEYWLNTTIVPIINESNQITEYMAISNNITEVFHLHEEVNRTQKDIIYKMGQIGETRSAETGNHVKRVANYSKELGRLYGLSNEEVELLFIVSPMHDIGKVGIPDNILNKQGKLDDDEFKIMKTHAAIGSNVLSGSQSPVLSAAKIVAHEHHEKWNGSGYPKGKSGTDIHVFGRITALADVFDALGSDRCYKKAWDEDRIFQLFREERGKHFEPKLVDLFFQNIEIFLNIKEKYKD